MSVPLLASTLLLPSLPLSSEKSTIKKTMKKTRSFRKGRRRFQSSLDSSSLSSSSSSVPRGESAAPLKNNGQISSPSSSKTTEEKDQRFFLRQLQRKEEDNKEERKVIILWDLDNVNPGTTCERFAINAKRIKKAGEKFGRVVAFRAFAGMQTSRDLSECCNNDNEDEDDTKNNDENEDDTSTKVIKGFKRTFERLNLKTEFYLDGPDAADLRLGRRLMEFANESQGKKIQDVPAFITRRAEEACFLTSDDVNDDINEITMKMMNTIQLFRRATRNLNTFPFASKPEENIETWPWRSRNCSNWKEKRFTPRAWRKSARQTKRNYVRL